MRRCFRGSNAHRLLVQRTQMRIESVPKSLCAQYKLHCHLARFRLHTNWLINSGGRCAWQLRECRRDFSSSIGSRAAKRSLNRTRRTSIRCAQRALGVVRIHDVPENRSTVRIKGAISINIHVLQRPPVAMAMMRKLTFYWNIRNM